ncbi:hypothetical protein QTI66_09525 [Variovorax sp. J22R133]|uniref:chorismate transformation enzyme, FkbO/Hyg5 family n=1 Tax=Variovorax brevis TaxID=3053503 RepID=UPI00257893EF|nr:Rid family hydrolase [Variovorax sp. J22R133]MDM0112389.1 hypothetical protein [Variovorax sp. J22R133]
MSALRVRRMPLAGILVHAANEHAALGALGYGASGGRMASLAKVDARVLLGGAEMVDAWHAGEQVDSGITGAVRWRCDGHWMTGAIDIDEAAAGTKGLATLIRQAYLDLFDALSLTGCSQLLRVWNYMPRINAEDGGSLERYRQFNAGRREAFEAAGRGVLEGAPAASMLGTQHGQLCVRFLAGRHAPLPIENPRQVSAYHYPPDYGPSPPIFSRAALADLGGEKVALFISGTASIVGHESLHVDDVREQVCETLRNLRAVIESANARTTARFDLAQLDCVVYVRNADQAQQVRQVLENALGTASHTMRHAIYLEADICRRDLLVEIEAHAIASGALRD